MKVVCLVYAVNDKTEKENPNPIVVGFKDRTEAMAWLSNKDRKKDKAISRIEMKDVLTP